MGCRSLLEKLVLEFCGRSGVSRKDIKVRRKVILSKEVEFILQALDEVKIDFA